MSDITIFLPDGSPRTLPEGATATTVAEGIGSRLAKAAIAARVDGEEWDLGRPLPDGAEVAIITVDTEAGRHILRHSTSHVLAQAVTQLFPGRQVLHRPGDRGRLLLRLRPARRRARSATTTSPRSRRGCARS